MRSRIKAALLNIGLLSLLLLCACGGGGGGGGGGGADSSGGSKLFVAVSNTPAIASIADSNPSPGTMAVDRIVHGTNTTLSLYIYNLALDAANDRLYVANGRSIVVFNGISTANGDVAPARTIYSIPSGTIGGFNGMYLDTVHDVLYVGNNNSLTGPQQIYVFNNASTASNVNPSRILSVPFGYMTAVVVDVPRNILYLYAQPPGPAVGSEIAAFDNASTVSGTVAPNRTIRMGNSYSSGPPRGMFIDTAGNRLYVSVFGQVLVFDNASTKNGSVQTTAAPERSIILPLFGDSDITLDTVNNRLYTVDGYGVNIISNASTANGSVPMTRVLAPSGSYLQAIAVRP